MIQGIDQQPTGEANPPARFGIAALALIAANLVPLAGVLWLGWSVSSIIVLYWFENIVTGAINVARLVKVSPGGEAGPAAKAGKLVIVPFFMLHYFFFCAVHGLFVFAMFPDEDGFFPAPVGMNPLQALGRAISIFATPLALPAAILAGSHLISFFTNYLGRREYERLDLKRVMSMPYRRIIVLHLTILLGGFATTALGQPIWLLAVMVLVKIAVDLHMHVAEHRKATAPATAPAGGRWRPRRHGPR